MSHAIGETEREIERKRDTVTQQERGDKNTESGAKRDTTVHTRVNIKIDTEIDTTINTRIERKRDASKHGKELRTRDTKKDTIRNTHK